MEAFFELKLGIMTMESYEKIFLELLKYVDFVKDETIEIQWFLSGILDSYRDKI